MSSIKRSTDPEAPDVSVVIVNWNTRELLQQTLESLYRETQQVTFETIVVDNGSTDGSFQLLQHAWKQVCSIALAENKGFAVANNIGIRIASGRYVLLLNSDTIVLPTTLCGMVSFLDAYPDTGCVGCRHLNLDGSLQRSMDSFPNLLNDLLSYSELYRLPLLLPFLQRRFPWWSDHNHVRDVDWVNGACMMVRRQVIAKVGGLDECYFIYAEEIDWCYRMRKAGWSVYFVPEAEIIHIGGQAMNRAADIRVVLKYKGQCRFYRKHYPVWKYIVLRTIVMNAAALRLVIICIFCSLSLFREDTNNVRWELLTQESVVTEPVTMLRAWWRILWLPW